MKQFDLIEAKVVFFGSEIVRRFTFKAKTLWDSYANLAVIRPVQVAIFALSRGKSAHFQKRDCFECLLPHDSIPRHIKFATNFI